MTECTHGDVRPCARCLVVKMHGGAWALKKNGGGVCADKINRRIKQIEAHITAAEKRVEAKARREAFGEAIELSKSLLSQPEERLRLQLALKSAAATDPAREESSDGSY